MFSWTFLIQFTYYMTGLHGNCSSTNLQKELGNEACNKPLWTIDSGTVYTVAQLVAHIGLVTVSLQVPLGWWVELQMPFSPGK